ncbi:beta-ketoacyl-ACP synthase III [Trinickia caryophylli]|uniref:Beta-ketoacyl-[acyl-carrier-protein] synthase III n=1 Tax=Trinickia caryophylli TaxID=28094 RepID=A0A1X7FNE6_TRICW|nr:beta-ketoacyl-ACP synthase III [Trinickia caryophylli]PMS13877.1 ketoacyl-ACP synthase III [Trinickia caryophylli]TRX14375.1 ketoacyl-ACP synthase III [Trinickia caryophylli]WQE14209.1 beta-ketoacyl-ACP synthase III [Trinickia caryophylli]SMF55640.1 3-oxoacyl-[acyl-carrier-protein] synthase III [Trinickia caryophylli]GLU33283.1 3-oxoacyl-[acyl-carrier-protein] synthase 3 [Trinickia caryophylli]
MSEINGSVGTAPPANAATIWGSRVVGCGSALPERRVTNHDLAMMVDTSDEWIVQRTGIKERRVAADGENTSDLAIAAAVSALGNAGIRGEDVDLVVVATCTPDRTVPATACRVQAALGMTGGIAFDVQAVCSGFVFALSVADNMIRLGQARTAIVIGAETMSRIIDWKDRNSCVLFGDGAGAVVLRAERRTGARFKGILSTHLHSDGRHEDKIRTNGGASSTQTAGTMHLEGRDVFVHAVVNLAEASQEALTVNGLTKDDLDWVVPHQANRRIVQTLGEKLQLPMEKIVLTLDHHGNTSAASIPLALAEAVADGRIKEDDLVLTPAMGAGFTWGSALIRW